MNFTKEAHKILEDNIVAGDVVVDATMGNGFDTLFLSDIVGSSGKVFAFDVQELALESTRAYLEKNAKYPENAKLILKSHEFIAEELKVAGVDTIRAATFNLGYLPKSDKLVTTKAQSSVKAMRACLDFADKDSFCLSVLCYIGHNNAYEEYLAVDAFFKENFGDYDAFRDLNNEKSPILLVGYLGDKAKSVKNVKKNV